MTEKAEHALVVKTHWKTGAARLREQLRTSQQEAEKKAAEPRDVFAQRAGIEAFVARAALELVDELLQAVEAAEGALPIPLTLGQHLVLEGKVLRVINAWRETEATDGRARWGIVTEGEEQPAAPADATTCTPNCDGSDMCTGGKEPAPFVLPSEAELADRIFGPGTAETLQTRARYLERPSGPPVRIADGPGCTPAIVNPIPPEERRAFMEGEDEPEPE